ncbi:hypothetical protein [Paenibacillus ehimensis]|uniref:Uncharacterized protein n=1 Tax=Paenibacillus ehimensis TaxID=79264 RepID=A0ABT8VM92_9BACL|nr:hypothetical protein [Paenibacillus ehimensis]MDO3682086.1 hypothetical protein [Paenibacillus ehimensis]
MDKIFHNWKVRLLVYGTLYLIMTAVFYVLDMPSYGIWAFFIIILFHKLFLRHII